MDNKQKKMAFLGVLLLGCVATSWLQQGKEAKQAVPTPILNKQLASSTAKEKKEKTSLSRLYSAFYLTFSLGIG